MGGMGAKITNFFLLKKFCMKKINKKLTHPTRKLQNPSLSSNYQVKVSN